MNENISVHDLVPNNPTRLDGGFVVEVTESVVAEHIGKIAPGSQVEYSLVGHPPRGNHMHLRVSA
jgi:hypothetical protein